MPLQIYLFGWPRIERDSQPVRISRRKSVALIAYLATNSQPVGREVLAALFYPESGSALAYLRRDLSELRKQLGRDALLSNEEICLDASVSLWVDVAAFRETLELEASHGHFPERPCNECSVALESAVNLYADDFLAGFNLTNCPQFDEWRFFQAESLRQSLDQALQKLIRWYESQGQWGPAIERGRRWLSLDPLHEPAQRKLMELVATKRPFLYFPIRNHCEQQYHVTHRLERYRAGRRLDYAETNTLVLAEVALENLGSDTDGYCSHESGSASRAAEIITQLL